MNYVWSVPGPCMPAVNATLCNAILNYHFHAVLVDLALGAV